MRYEQQSKDAMFGDLRSLLHGEPDEHRFENLCHMIDRWPDPSRREVAIPYAIDQLAR